jgi:threonine aldolase
MSAAAIAVDLFSDTVTRPTAAMRRFMCDAEVGDEQQFEDPSVNRLQDMVADLLGKEAALFLPSGTMCNQVAFSVHCRAGDEILLHETAHPILYEAGGAAALVGAVFRPLPGPRGMFTAAQVRQAVRPPVHFMPRTRVVSIEQTANIVGGVCWPIGEIKAVCTAAREAGLARHMDGARLMNAVVSSGTPAADFAAHFDSVWLDLTKGLGAPVGAVLAGSRSFIEEAWVFKQRLGGAMRQAGIIAAAGIYALAADRVETNIVIFDVRGTGLSGEEFAGRTLASHAVRFSVIGPTTVRAVTHLDIPPGGIEVALDAARAAIAEVGRR